MSLQKEETKKGKVCCGRIVHFRSKEPNKFHPTLDKFININVTSGTRSRWKSLSPMIIGEFEFIEDKCINKWYPDGIHPGFKEFDEDKTRQIAVCQRFENMWQTNKVYDIDMKDGVIQKSFFERRAKMFSDPKGHRRSLPKSKGKVISAYYDRKLYNYLESRYFYCTFYEYLIQEIPEYKELVEMLNKGINLHIVGYDGKNIDMTKEGFKKAYDDPESPFGHELVICAMLMGFCPWNTELN